MGIEVEFNPGLALRNISEFKKGNRKLEECIPEHLKERETYDFLKKGQRNFWLEGEVPLTETKGNHDISKPLASVLIIEPTHFVHLGEIYTRGKYQVVEVFDPEDERIHFNGFDRVHY